MLLQKERSNKGQRERRELCPEVQVLVFERSELVVSTLKWLGLAYWTPIQDTFEWFYKSNFPKEANYDRRRQLGFPPLTFIEFAFRFMMVIRTVHLVKFINIILIWVHFWVSCVDLNWLSYIVHQKSILWKVISFWVINHLS